MSLAITTHRLSCSGSAAGIVFGTFYLACSYRSHSKLYTYVIDATTVHTASPSATDSSSSQCDLHRQPGGQQQYYSGWWVIPNAVIVCLHHALNAVLSAHYFSMITPEK